MCGEMASSQLVLIYTKYDHPKDCVFPAIICAPSHMTGRAEISVHTRMYVLIIQSEDRLRLDQAGLGKMVG